MTAQHLRIRWFERKQDYQTTWQAMQQFTATRDAFTLDEVWLLEHHPVFTQGQNGKPEHILDAGDIPIVKTDRGGQVTYHGPGQLMIYTLIDVKRKQLNVRQFVSALETTIVEMLSQFNINAYAKKEAPGVYIQEQKIASIGLRIKRGCAYHGIAFNVSLDLRPFSRINPCGFSTLKMIHFAAAGGLNDLKQTGEYLVNSLMRNFGYTSSEVQSIV